MSLGWYPGCHAKFHVARQLSHAPTPTLSCQAIRTLRTLLIKHPWDQISFQIYLVQFSRSAVSDSVTPWTAARQASLSITNSRSLLTLMSIESVVPSNSCFVIPFSSCLQTFPAKQKNKRCVCEPVNREDKPEGPAGRFLFPQRLERIKARRMCSRA